MKVLNLVGISYIQWVGRFVMCTMYAHLQKYLHDSDATAKVVLILYMHSVIDTDLKFIN